MVTAQEKVFNTAELMEMILLDIDPMEIITNTQRVCKKWHSSLAASPKFQQNLFLKARTKALPTSCNTTEARLTKNNYMARVIPNLFNVDISNANIEDGYITRFVLHHHIRELLPRWLASNASWRYMFISQPPITKLQWEVNNNREDSHVLINK
ncbi:hypothetical protein F4819DRAFT_491931 [Hypoxylon fuscum]|nr:hypothetical protein F4819DRAFT_491931 [Hypoxylon fuscum]